MTTHRFITQSLQTDPRATETLKAAQALGFHQLQRVECQDLYFIESQLSQQELQQLALKLLSDPVTQSITWDEIPATQTPLTPDSVILEVALRPGVTDPVAHEIIRAAHELGLVQVQRAATGSRYLLEGLNGEQAEQLAKALLANAVIQHWKIGSIEPSFPEEAAASGIVDIIPIRDLSNDELLALSKDRRAALDLAEMQAIRAYCQKENRDLTDVEFETIAQTWSEHCVHKTFKAKIEISNWVNGNYQSPITNYSPTIDSLIKTYLKSATDKINVPWVISAFVDNAGIIDFDDEFEISFKAETHNHPSAIEPFGGANTGVGGVIRDILGVSAKPIANTDVLCFGPQNLNPNSLPEGVLHPRRIQSGVVAGVQDYGNKIGIPTVNGAILYDEGYTANPLVFCGCVGIAPKGKHKKNPQVGDRVIVLGGRTGRDGLRGATFSSMTMDAQTGEVSGTSVQIGDPITEKGLIDVIVRARDLGLYNDITDCGAGGLSSAVGEMASKLGCDVELTKVRLKYPNLAPWEIWLSEAQERMVLAVSADKLQDLQTLCDTFDTELTDIGAFTGDERLVVRYDGNIVVNMDNDFLHDGIPQRQLKAVIREQRIVNSKEIPQLSSELISNHLLSLLSHPNIASKASVIRIYDHEVQGGTVIKPLTGLEADAPSDAAVLKPIGTKGTKGIVLSNGINPEFGKRDAYKMAWSVMDEAIRNAVAVGADPDHIAVLDNFCWGDPLRPETLGSLVEACRGCHDAALFYGTPFISGKDSLNNEYLGADGLRHAIPPTLLISAIGVVQNINQSITMDLKEAGSILYLIGEIPSEQSSVPDVPAHTAQTYRALYQAITNGLVRSAHDLSEGGLAVAAAEMCIGGRLGMDLEIKADTVFTEVNGCLLVEVAPTNAYAFENKFTDLPITKIGKVTSDPILKLGDQQIKVEELVHAFNTPNSLMKPQALILQAHGTNRDYDVAEALTLAGADPHPVPLNDLRAGKKHFAGYQMLVVAGGFSYADSLGAGKLLALDLTSYFNEEISTFVEAGKPVIGICNGFQALVKSGILPGEKKEEGTTLTFNEQGHFECRWVNLAPVSQTCIWTKGLEDTISCPIAHGEGNFQISKSFPLSSFIANDQVALTYIHADGSPANGDYPINPNGSILDIAGICNPQGNVLGLMPHPENHIHPYQHPHWTRGVKGNSGLVLFENGVKYAKDFA